MDWIGMDESCVNIQIGLDWIGFIS